MADLSLVEVGDVVEVEWTDAWEDDEDEDATLWRDLYPVHTLGVVRRLYPVLSISTETLPAADGYRSVTHIPLGMVQKVTKYARSN